MQAGIEREARCEKKDRDSSHLLARIVIRSRTVASGSSNSYNCLSKSIGLGYNNTYRLERRGGERGIRTPGALRLSGFQDRRIRPLCHPSYGLIESYMLKMSRQYVRNIAKSKS